MKIKKYLIIPLLLVLALVFVPPSAAVGCPSNACWINITVYRWDTGGALSGAVVANASNATQTSTTGANGQANISWYDYSNSSASGGHNLTITGPAGYNSGNINKIEITVLVNDTLTISLRPLSVLNSAITEASLTKSGATVSWTVNHSTVGNRIIYSLDSGLLTNLFYTAWSNSTSSPSFAIAGLSPSQKVYYRVESYNTPNSTYNDKDTGDFTTSAGNAVAIENEDEDLSYAIKNTNTPLSKAITSKVSKAPTNKSKRDNVLYLLIGVVFVLLIIVVYYVVEEKKFSPKRRRR